MISNETIEQSLLKDQDIEYVKVEGDGYHYQLTIVSDIFIGQSKVKRQQWVYGKLKEYITSGELHALTMKTLTKDEWETTRG